MSGLLVLRALLFAGECFLASLLLPLLGLAITAPLRRAALRHLVWATMFGVLAVLPLVALLLPPRLIVEHVAAAPVAAPLDAAPVVATAPPALFTPENIVLLLVALWLAGLCWQALRLGVGGLGLARLRRQSAAFASETMTRCAVRLARGEDGPSTFGILRPIVLLPRSAESWPAARLEAVLRHEAAHVARRDAASQLLARLVCGLYWFNPLLWLALRRLRRDAEIAADDDVLAGGMTPSAYAAELVSLAAERQGVAPGVAMAGPPLAERVQAVLENNSSRKGVTGMDMAKTVTLGLAATLLLGAARFDLAVAQDTPAPAPFTPRVVNADNNVELDVAKTLDVQRNVGVKVDAVKARADDVARMARARAEAEADKAKRNQYRSQAAQVAGQAAKVKEDADRIAADARRIAADRMLRLSQATPSTAQAHASASQEAETSTNGVVTVRRTRQGDDNAADVAGRDADAARQDAQTPREGAQIFRRDRLTGTGDGSRSITVTAAPNVSETVAKALADARISETIAKALADAHLDEKTRKAIEDAHIEERVREAMVRVQPQIDAAMDRARRTITVRPFSPDAAPAPFATPRPLYAQPMPPMPAMPAPPAAPPAPPAPIK